MDKCKCWEEFKQIKGWYENKPMYIIVPICNGTKEREKCSCNGDKEHCDFYKIGIGINTAEMYIKANIDGKTYQCLNYRYNKTSGFYNSNNFKKINIEDLKKYSIDDFLNLKWEEEIPVKISRSELENRFNLMITEE